MKKFILLCSLIAVFVSCEKKEPLPPNTYKINVSAPGVLNGIRTHIKIIDDRRQEITIDTAMVVNEAFTFTGNVSNAAIRILTVNGVQGTLAFVLEPGEMDIELYKDSIQYSIVEGTKNNDAFNDYKNNYRAINDKFLSVRNERDIARQDPNGRQLMEEKDIELRKVGEQRKDYPHDFIDENPDLDVSLLVLETQMIGTNQNLERFKTNVAALEKVINKNAANKFIGQRLHAFIAQKEIEARLDIGRKAPDFKSPDPNGNFIALEDIKGKATIIDFWAAWCGPCRKENPNIVKIYEKYHDKGLEIIGVSLDGRSNQSDPKRQWLKAIEDDGLPWHHVSSLMYFRDPVAELYNIHAIPATFVLDENGIIVGKKLRGQALENKIAELLD
ncbi:MAG: TlpA disulfide reductase family protein [Flavobacteriaceae bacterium]